MISGRIKEFVLSLGERQPSLIEALEIINFGLDIMNEIKGRDEYSRFRNFDLRLSMKLFSFLIEESKENIDSKYWNDSINELKFDLNRFYRTLETKKHQPTD